ncbi:MAG: hypothetical protein CMJ78_03800, partial [Planctomycetaceae bacterium]|nr:hypothetical protein [Planctomycetaceae bacterium]
MRVFTLIAGVAFARVAIAELGVSPAKVVIDSPESTVQVLVSDDSGDRTRAARYKTANPKVAVVSKIGRILPVGDGKTEIVIRDGAKSIKVPVEVKSYQQPVPISFEHQVVPIFSKAGCNSGGCHGKAEGQNGFKLSIFGFDAAFDFDALVKEGRGRRVVVSSPDDSLLLRKAAALVPHGGGAKIEKNGQWYRRIQRWISEGALLDNSPVLPAARIEVEPLDVILAPNKSQQLRVVAIDADGNRRCVTAESEFQSNATQIADVDHEGLIEVTGVPGEAAILVRYMGQVAVSRITLPQTNVAFKRPTENNFIDKHVWDKLKKLGIQPSEAANDATFMRRAYLDTIGTLPTATEARKFLSDTGADKRTRLIDELLKRDEYAVYWGMRWADILRVDRLQVTSQGAVAMTRWLRRQFEQNTPYDQFARQIVTASGDAQAESPAGFYKALKKPDAMGRSISQLLLGVRIECAQCH